MSTKVVIEHSTLDRLRSAAAGARGLLTALQYFHPQFAHSTVRETLADLEAALEAAREFDYQEE